jgi:hypothetical protein
MLVGGGGAAISRRRHPEAQDSCSLGNERHKAIISGLAGLARLDLYEVVEVLVLMQFDLATFAAPPAPAKRYLLASRDLAGSPGR